MGLDFLRNIKDKTGAAVYLIFSGDGYQKKKIDEYYGELSKNTVHEVRVFSVREREGSKLVDFYDIRPEMLPAILIVRDNDQLAGQWFGSSLPRVKDVIYRVNQISS